MSSQGNTKGKILKLIARGDNTLTLISRRLGLAPSTVSKHLHDMELSGEISQQENSHVKKWKYYRINHGDEPEGGMVQPIRAGFGKKAPALGAYPSPSRSWRYTRIRVTLHTHNRCTCR